MIYIACYSAKDVPAVFIVLKRKKKMKTRPFPFNEFPILHHLLIHSHSFVDEKKKKDVLETLNSFIDSVIKILFYFIFCVHPC